MFKPFTLIVLVVLISLSNGVPLESVSNEFNETTTVSTTTSTTAEATTATTTTTSETSSYKPVANFAQYNGKLLANQSTESSMNGRIINNNNNNGVTAIATQSLSLTVILVLIAVVTLVVSGIILSALFVMRRRFSIWRVNGNNNCESKEIPTTAAAREVEGDLAEQKEKLTDDATDSCTKQEAKDECVTVVLNEKDPELVKQVMAAVACDSSNSTMPVSVNVGHSNEAATDLISNEKVESEQQASPSSSSPLIEKVNDEIEQPNKEQHVTSSSSLIVNVLNELSESVACKLNDAESDVVIVSSTVVEVVKAADIDNNKQE